MAKAAKRPATNEWGTPDPCNAGAYPQVSGTLPTQWAWEFFAAASIIVDGISN